jgi:hypothetical protein
VTGLPTGAEELTAAVVKLVGQVSHWTPSRWAASGVSGLSRAEMVHELVQWLADRAADAEGQPRRRVPRLDNDLVLPDQLRVVAADLVAAGPPGLSDAATRVAEVRRSH